ncbi:MAG TPA: hypothetical protein VH370_26045 [Humisphaera sp.]|nr:hypothetical protein [Humisphaera sp.]
MGTRANDENLAARSRTRALRWIVTFVPLALVASLCGRSWFRQDVMTCNKSNGQFTSVCSYGDRLEIFFARGFSGSPAVNYYSLSVKNPRAWSYRFAQNCTTRLGFVLVFGNSDLLFLGNSLPPGDCIVVFPYWAMLVLAAVWAKIFAAISRRGRDRSRRLRGFSVDAREI